TAWPRPRGCAGSTPEGRGRGGLRTCRASVLPPPDSGALSRLPGARSARDGKQRPSRCRGRDAAHHGDASKVHDRPPSLPRASQSFRFLIFCRSLLVECVFLSPTKAVLIPNSFTVAFSGSVVAE